MIALKTRVSSDGVAGAGLSEAKEAPGVRRATLQTPGFRCAPTLATQNVCSHSEPGLARRKNAAIPTAGL